MYSKKTGERQGVIEKNTPCQTKPHLCNISFFVDFDAGEKVKMRFSRNGCLSASDFVSATPHIILGFSWIT